MDSDQRSRSASYYSILGVDKNSSITKIRSAYRKLAMQWHPDRWTRNPSVLGEAKRKFQQIQEAYSVLSDRRKRTMYDAGLYDPDDVDEQDEGFVDFLQEMVSLMADVEREEKDYSMEELQQMFVEMAQGYDSCSTWYGGPSSFFQLDEEENKDSSCRHLNKRARLDSSKPTVEKDSYVHASGLETFERTSFAN
ncbi:chaperone protein dnaJ 6-like [Macadamia integrifolia]|uniref:chaperone protein dnaJ 6-like n=1 Tax=Macadamia integrifolia TaxID=60698 RepID=UPI001C4F7A55|nr:chaperone protein dnaJ 6-like [Macadamia integrifolia]